MIPTHIPKALFEKTASALEKKFDKRLKKLDKKIDETISELSEKMKPTIKTEDKIFEVTIWNRLNESMKKFMEKIKSFTVNLFKRK